MRSDPLDLTGDQIASRAIAGVGNDCLNLLLGDIRMGLDQVEKPLALVHGTGRGLYCRNNLIGIIDDPMGLIARSTFESTLSNQRRIWIGRAAKLPIGFIELSDFAHRGALVPGI